MRADDAGPDVPDPGPSILVESVLEILDEELCPPECCDQVMRLIESWEKKYTALLEACELAQVWLANSTPIVLPESYADGPMPLPVLAATIAGVKDK